MKYVMRGHEGVCFSIFSATICLFFQITNAVLDIWHAFITTNNLVVAEMGNKQDTVATQNIDYTCQFLIRALLAKLGSFQDEKNCFEFPDVASISKTKV